LMSEPLLGNYVTLSEGIPKRLRFESHQIVQRLITDPMTKSPKTVNVLEFKVLEEDGIAVSKIYSVTSEKHAQQFAPFLEGQGYRGKVFTIIPRGRGYLREYSVAVS